MVIRDTVEEDLHILKDLMENRSYHFDLPDSLEGFVVSLSAESEEGLVFGLAARPTVEFYLIGNPEWSTPAMRLEVLKSLHAEMEKRLAELGYTDGHIWIPPELSKSFSRRLIKTFRFPNGAPKWVKSTWDCLTGFVGGEPNV